MSKNLIDHKARQVGIGRYEIEMAFYPITYPFNQRKPRLTECSKYRLSHCLYLFIENPLEKLLLGPKIIMKHRMRHPGCLSNGNGPRSGKSLGEKLPLGRPKDVVFLVARWGFPFRFID